MFKWMGFISEAIMTTVVEKVINLAGAYKGRHKSDTIFLPLSDQNLW